MASVQEAVQRLTIEARAVGVDETTQSTRRLTQAQNELAQISQRNETTTGRFEKALLSQQRALQLTDQSTRQLSAANDNAASSWQSVNDNMKTVGSGFLSTAESIVTTTGHLKLVALAAYALSPAFRSITNTGFAAVVGSMGMLGPAAASAARTIVSVLSPALSFIARLSIPIVIAVGTWKLLNSVITTGSELLEKYGNATRTLFDSNVDENLKKLTKFQTDSISFEQVKQATDLGTRLREAKKEISDFFSVSFDLTDPALKFQSVWVSIVETLAKGLSILNDMSGAAERAARAAGNSSIWDKLGLNWGWNLPGKQQLLEGNNTPEPSREELFNLGRTRLTGGMGGGFAGRFSQSINDLANPPKKEETKAANDAADAWNRATDSIDKHAARLSADTIAVGKSAAEQEQLRAEFSLLEAAKIADRDVTDDQIKAYTELRGHMTAQQALQAAGIKWDDDERAAFDRTTASIKLRAQELEKAKNWETISRGRQTAFLLPEDVQIAQQLKGQYADVATALNSAEAAAIRLNNSFADFSNTSRDTLKGFATDMRTSLQAGATAWQSFEKAGSNALNKIADKLMNMAIDNLWKNAFPGGGSGLLGLLGIGSPGGSGLVSGDPLASAKGNVFDQGRIIHPYALGGITSDILVKPTYFPMANGGIGLGGEAGPEAIMPLRRGSDGRLGVSGAGGSGSTINFSPVYNIDATGSNMTEEQFMAILDKNNKQVTADINKALLR